MTTAAFSIARCSRQDFAARMAYYDAVIMDCKRGRRDQNEAYASFAEQLHLAMGHRPDQAEF